MDQNRTDSELLTSFASAANESAFALLVERYLALVLRTARRCIPDAHAADDIAQAVFFCLARKAHHLDGRDLAGWLVRATTLASKEAMRKHSRRLHHERASAVENPPSSPPRPDAEAERLVHKALLRLSSLDRGAVLLRFYRDLSYPQIAVELSCSEDAARKRVDRSLQRLHEWLESQAMQITPAAIGSVVAAWVQQGGGLTPAACAAAATSGQLTAMQMAIAQGLLKLLSFGKIAALSIATIIAISASAAIVIPALPASGPSSPPSAPGAPVAVAVERQPAAPAPQSVDADPPIPQVPYALPTQPPTATPITPKLLPQWLEPISTQVLGVPPGPNSGSYSRYLPLPDGSLLAIGGRLDGQNGRFYGSYFIVRWDPETWRATSMTGGLGASSDQVAVAANGSTALISFPNWFDRARHGGYMKFIDIEHGELAPPVYSRDGWFQPLGVSPDGKTGYCRMTGQGPLQVWDMHAGKKREDIPCPAGMTTQLLCDPCGRFVALGGFQGDDKVHTLDLADRSWHTLEGHHDSITAMAVSPDGQLLATGSDDCTVRLWDVNTRKSLYCLRGHNAGIGALAFNAEGTILASSAGKGSLEANYNGKVTMAVAENSLRLWRVSDGTVVGGGELPGYHTTHLAFSADGVLLRAGSSEQMEFSVDTLLKVNTASLLPPKAQIRLEELRTIETTATMARCAELAPGGSSLTVALYGALEHIDLPSFDHQTLRQWDRYGLAMNLQAGIILARRTSSAYPPLECLDIATGKPRWQADGFVAHTAAFSPDGTKIAGVAGRYYQPTQGLAICPRSELRMIDPANGATLHTIADVQDTANAIVFSPDSKLLYVGSGHFQPGSTGALEYLNCAIEAFDIPTGKRTLAFEQLTRPVTAMALSTDGKRLYASTNAGISAFDTTKGAKVARVDIGAEVTCLDVSPDGKFIAAGDMQNNVNILNAATLQMLARDDRPKNAVLLVRFFSNDQFISHSHADPLRLWQLLPQPPSATQPTPR